jgi:transposase-like protein
MIRGNEMTDIKGDPKKQPPGCKGDSSCPNMKEVGGGFEGERYRCPVCGESYFLDYEDMK